MTRQAPSSPRKAPIIRSKGLNRRTFLRGAVGGTVVALGLPILDIMLNDNGTALADGGLLPRRLVTWFWGNGCALNDVADADSGPRFWPESQGPGYEVTPQLAPLADAGVLAYCSLLSKFDVKAGSEGRRAHHDGCTLFSGYPFIELPASGTNYSSQSGGPTVDQVAAALIGSQTYLPSIQLQVSKRIVTTEGPTLQYLSHKGPAQPLPQLANPQDAWAKLFASFTPDNDPTTPHRLAALDAVREDARALQQRVGSTDRIRLEAHLDSVAQIRKQIAAMAPECVQPQQPNETNTDSGGQEALVSVNTVMSQLLALAFSCEITRVASVQFTGSVGFTVFGDLGHEFGHHDMTHNAAQNEFVDQATIYTMARLADFLVALRDTPEGDGNVLDNSCVLVSSDCSTGLTHRTFDQPVIVAGGGGGSLRHPGIHYRSPNEENTSDILLACLKTVCPEVTEVGGGIGYSSTPLSEILI